MLCHEDNQIRKAMEQLPVVPRHDRPETNYSRAHVPGGKCRNGMMKKKRKGRKRNSQCSLSAQPPTTWAPAAPAGPARRRCGRAGRPRGDVVLFGCLGQARILAHTFSEKKIFHI